jgi:transcriptional regulator with GAF, ATPase, and Fis domain
LFYRLVVFPLDIPPLRERREDIAQLAAHFVRVTARKMNRPPTRLTKAHAEQLTAYNWPGNIRELQNTVERAVILSQGGPLQFELPDTNASQPSSSRSLTPPVSGPLTRAELKRHERESIVAALKQTRGKIFGADGAAELLGMKPTTLASRIKALGIEKLSK